MNRNPIIGYAPKAAASAGTLIQIQKIYGQSAAIQKELVLSDFRNFRGAATVMHHEKDRLILQTADIGDVLVIENESAPIYQNTIRLSEVYTNPHEVFTLRAYIAENGPDGTAITRESGSFKHEGLSIEGGVVLAEYNRFQGELDKSGFTADKIFAVEIIHSHPFFDVLLGDGTFHFWSVHRGDVEAGLSLFNHGIVIITAVVPNGYRYSVAFRKLKNGTVENVTRKLFNI